MKTPTKTQNSLPAIAKKLLAVGALALISTLTAQADYKSVVQADHPVGYWPLDLTVDTQKDTTTGQYIASDLSGYNNFGEYVNIAPGSGQTEPGPSASIPNAAAFDGIDTYVDLTSGSNANLLQIVGAITMEAWVQPNLPQQLTDGGKGEYGLILSKGYDLNEQTDNIDLDIRSDNNEKSYLYWGGVFTTWNGLDQQSATGGFQATTNWTHVVATWEQMGAGTTNGLWSLYVNGNLVNANVAVGPSLYAGPPYVQGFAFTDGWAIGNGTADGGAINWREFLGNICQVALYTNALTPNAVLAHYNAGLYGATVVPAVPAGLSAYATNVLASHPVGYWPLDLTVDTKKDPATSQYIATDLSGYNNFGEYVNIAPSSGQTVAGPSAYLAHAAAFNGNNTYVDLTLGTNADLLQVVGAISMEAWVQPNLPQQLTGGGKGEYGLILSKGYDLSEETDNIDLDIRSDDNEQTYLYWGGVFTTWNNLDQQSATGGFQATTNWTYVVATWEPMGSTTTNGLWSLYVNGNLVNANLAVGPSLYASPYPQGIAFTDGWAIGNGTADGGAVNWREFLGNICQVALYTNALTAAQVQSHYLLGLYDTNTPPPSLSVGRGSLGTIVVSWPASVSSSYALEQSPTLLGPWTPVTSTPQVTSSEYQVILSTGTKSMFYRLQLQ